MSWEIKLSSQCVFLVGTSTAIIAQWLYLRCWGNKSQLWSKAVAPFFFFLSWLAAEANAFCLSLPGSAFVTWVPSLWVTPGRVSMRNNQVILKKGRSNSGSGFLGKKNLDVKLWIIIYFDL